MAKKEAAPMGADKEFAKSVVDTVGTASPPTPIIVPEDQIVGACIKDSTLIDAKTALFAIYLLYKLNIITRYGIRESLDIIKKGSPDDLLKYLTDETKKI